MVSISGSFTDKNKWAGGIRRGQVEAAFDDPDGRDDLAIGEGASLTLVTKRVERPRPHVMLLIASDANGEPTYVASGYRLYGSDGELDALKSNPRAALDELIRRFGRDFSINKGAPTKFVERLHVDANDFVLDPGEGDITASSFVRRVATGGFDAAFVWVIDEARYRAALSSN